MPHGPLSIVDCVRIKKQMRIACSGGNTCTPTGPRVCLPIKLLEERELEFYARLFCKASLFFDTASLFGDKSGVVDNSLSGFS